MKSSFNDETQYSLQYCMPRSNAPPSRQIPPLETLR